MHEGAVPVSAVAAISGKTSVRRLPNVSLIAIFI
jgi:hypothetical protein